MSGTRSRIDALNAELAELADDYRFTPDELCEHHPLMGGTPEETLNNIAAVVIVLGDALKGIDDGGCEARDRGHRLLLSALEVAASDHAHHLEQLQGRMREVDDRRRALHLEQQRRLRELADDPRVDEILTARVRELSEQLDGGSHGAQPRLVGRNVRCDGVLWDLVYEYPDGSIEGRRRVRGRDAGAKSDVGRGGSPTDADSTQ